MTTSDFDVSLVPASEWWVTEGRDIPAWLHVLTLDARVPSTGFDRLVGPLLVQVPEMSKTSLFLLGMGTQFDASSPLNAKLGRRRSIWEQVEPVREQVPGEPVVEETLKVGEAGVRWGLRRVGHADIGDALDSCRWMAAVVLATARDDLQTAAYRMVLSAVSQPLDRTALLRSAAAEMKQGDLLARGVGTHGDPIGIDVLGERGILEHPRVR